MGWLERVRPVRGPVMIARARTGLTIALLRAGAIAAKFGITLFIASFLDLQALGSYGLVAGASVIVPVLAGMGIIGVLGRASVTQELSEVTAAFVPYWAYLCVLYAVVTAACLPWAYLHDQAAFTGLIGLLLFMEHLNSDVLIVLSHRRMPLLANLLLAVRTVVWIGSYVALAFWFPALRNLSAVLAFWCLGAATALLCFLWFCRDWPWHFRRGSLRGMTNIWSVARASRTLYLNELANTGGQYVDRYIVGAFLGLELAGVYFLFWSFANALSNLVSTSLLQVQQPAIILARPDRPKQGRMLGRLRRETAIASLLLAVTMAAFAELALAVIPRPTFSSHLSVLLVLLVGFVLRMIYEVEGIGLYSRHEDGNTLLSGVIVLVLSLLVTAASTHALGLLGPALAVVVSYSIGWFWRWRRNRTAYAVEPVSPLLRTGE